MGILLTCLFVIIPLAAAPFVFKRTEGHFVERGLVALSLVGAGLAVWVVAYTISIATVDDWSGAKMAPIVAMVRGSPSNYALYQDPSEGVMTGWIYGPVPAILLLPAAIFSTPTNIMLSANVMNLLWVLLPVLWFHIQAGRGWDGKNKTRWAVALLGGCAFLWICLPAESMTRSLFMAGADGPAMGLAALSCALIAQGRRTIHLILAATCAVLAVWSKQSMLPFLIVAPMYLYFIEGLRVALKYLAILFAAIVGISVPLILIFGGANMWFHMVTLPSSHPWSGEKEIGRALVLLRAFGELLTACGESISVLLFITLVFYLLSDGDERSTETSWSQWIARNPWSMLIAAAVISVPGGLLGYVKIGGFVNNLGLTKFFLTLAATLWATQLIVQPRSTRAASLLRSGLCLLILTESALPVFWEGKMQELTAYIAHVRDNRAEISYIFAKNHPGIAYFPWDPLPSLLAEGKLYHFEWGVSDRVLSGSLTLAQLRKHLPDQLVILAYPTSAQSRYILQNLPSVRDLGPDPQLPGFTVYGEQHPVEPQNQLPPARGGAGR